MPPRTDDGSPLPTVAETRKVISTITAYLDSANQTQKLSTTILRRLNRFEYVRTIKDLLGVDIDSFDPTGTFHPCEATRI